MGVLVGRLFSALAPLTPFSKKNQEPPLEVLSSVVSTVTWACSEMVNALATSLRGRIVAVGDQNSSSRSDILSTLLNNLKTTTSDGGSQVDSDPFVTALLGTQMGVDFLDVAMGSFKQA